MPVSSIKIIGKAVHLNFANGATLHRYATGLKTECRDCMIEMYASAESTPHWHSCLVRIFSAEMSIGPQNMTVRSSLLLRLIPFFLPNVSLTNSQRNWNRDFPGQKTSCCLLRNTVQRQNTKPTTTRGRWHAEDLVCLLNASHVVEVICAAVHCAGFMHALRFTYTLQCCCSIANWSD